MDIVGEHLKNLTDLMKRENWTQSVPYFKDIAKTIRTHEISKDLVKDVNDETLLVIMGASLAMILFMIIFQLLCWVCGKTVKKLDHILLTGPEDVGKTRMFLHLSNNTIFQHTCTSLSENVAPVKLGKKDFTLVDVPGNGRIVWPIFDKFKSSCARIMFLVDSCAVFKEQKAQTGEYLFTILTDPVIAKLKPTVIIVCTKQDAPMAKSTVLIKQVLESELTTLKKTSQATLSDISDSRDSAGRNKRAAILAEGRNGNVDLSLLPYKVKFVESSIAKGEKDCPILTFDQSCLR